MNYEIEGIKLLQRDGLMNYLTPTPGCYAITLNSKIVYVGQSKRVLYRCGEHYYHCLNDWSHTGQGTNYKYTLLKEAIDSGRYKIGFYQIDTNPENEEALIEQSGNPIMNIKIKGKNRNDIYKIKTIEELMETTTHSVNIKNVQQMIDEIVVPESLIDKLRVDLENAQAKSANSSLLEKDNVYLLKQEIVELKQEICELRMDLDDAKKQIEYLERGIDEGWLID